MVLSPLDDHDLLDIIGNYALALGQNSEYADCMLPDTVKRLLLQKLKSIDPQLHRPLYALFLTDAFVTGNNPEQWERNDILEYVTEREQKRLKFNLHQTLGWRDEKLYSACLYLYSMATVLQDVSWEELQLLCPDTWAIIQRKADSFDSPANMLEQAGLVVKGTIFALRPDLIGEYFVYTWLVRHPDKAQRFLYAVWQRPVPTAVFFNRMFHDYGNMLNENAKHWELIFPSNIPMSEDAAWLYAMLLASATHYCCIVDGRKQQTNLLKKLASDYPTNLKFVFALSEGLVNLSYKQDEQRALDTITHLERLATEHPKMPDIAILFAEGLVNLSYKQDEQGAQITIARLERLAAEHPEVSDIAILFAEGLVNLSSKQDEQGAQDTIARLENFAAKHPRVQDIAILLAEGLVNLSYKQDEQDSQVTIARLERLAGEYPGVPNIVIALAINLFNLSIKQNEQGARDTIARLECLIAKHPEMPDIAIVFAKGLLNLIIKQGEQEAQVTIVRLKHLLSEHPNASIIATELTKDLTILSYMRDKNGNGSPLNA